MEVKLNVKYDKDLDTYIITEETRLGFDMYVIYRNDTEICTFNSEASAIMRLYNILNTRKREYSEAEYTLNYKEF
jgi:hypothetical protein